MIQHHQTQDQEDKTYTALDLFDAIWQKKGVVMILTFKAQEICEKELKLTPYRYLFMDDRHAAAAQNLKNIMVIEGNYDEGQHLQQGLFSLHNQDVSVDHSSNSSTPILQISNLTESGSTPVLDSLSNTISQRSLQGLKSLNSSPRLLSTDSSQFFSTGAEKNSSVKWYCEISVTNAATLSLTLIVRKKPTRVVKHSAV